MCSVQVCVLVSDGVYDNYTNKTFFQKLGIFELLRDLNYDHKYARSEPQLSLISLLSYYDLLALVPYYNSILMSSLQFPLYCTCTSQWNYRLQQ